jgi:hypothetical protein
MCVISCDTKANVNEYLSTVHFADLCKVTADITKLKGSIRPQTNHRGTKFFVTKFDVILLFGLTELKAQIAWTQSVSRGFSLEYYNA